MWVEYTRGYELPSRNGKCRGIITKEITDLSVEPMLGKVVEDCQKKSSWFQQSEYRNKGNNSENIPLLQQS
jgi:hypothetical protein